MTLPTGAVFIDIALEQVDKKSPVDDVLMTAVAEDLYNLKTASSSGGGVLEWKVNFNLSALAGRLPFRRIDSSFISTARVLTAHGLVLEIPGSSGTLELDARKYRTPNTPVIEIAAQYSAAINSITRAGAQSLTQSIAKATPQVNTQSITLFKTAINVASIILLPNGLVRYNLSTALDADWVALADTVRFASCTSAANDGDFIIKRTNDDGLNNIVVFNPSGVAQTGAAGDATLLAFKYNLTNPATAEFVAGEKFRAAAHTSGGNNGDFTLYAVNSGGNNVVIKNAAGVLQAGVAGTVDALRWTYTLGAAAPADLVVGELALFAAHTSSGNNGNLRLTAVSGSTVSAYNTTGATQGGVAGTVDSFRWIYALPTDPTSSFSVGNNFRSTSATSNFNNGVFPVVQVNRSAANNLVIHNVNGVTQGGAVGTLTHTRKLVKFSADQSAIYATNSRVEMRGHVDNTYNNVFEVLQVNRGGGANYNIVVEAQLGAAQASPVGRVALESRSVFSTRPSITTTYEMQSATNGVLDATEKTIAAGRFLAIEVLQIPNGSPQNVTLQLT
jgi:hypothetical protein